MFNSISGIKDKTLSNQKVDFGTGTNFNGTGQGMRTGAFEGSTANTLKEKLQDLEKEIVYAAECLNEHKVNVNSIKEDKEKYQEILKQKSSEIDQKLSQKLDNVQEEMTRHFTNQEKENDRLQKQIAQLKNEKTSLQNLLIALQRRITDLEINVGNVEEQQ